MRFASSAALAVLLAGCSAVPAPEILPVEIPERLRSCEAEPTVPAGGVTHRQLLADYWLPVRSAGRDCRATLDEFIRALEAE
ncbi:hypothetical protein [Algihabitans albus]|uniref:hypothetical protein n=1 Tax=Algihabitans albus TaxID=2164067 RepID=UPI000E5CDFCE|nr:hypothetical protein [Algihabitans albus]